MSERYKVLDKGVDEATNLMVYGVFDTARGIWVPVTSFSEDQCGYDASYLNAISQTQEERERVRDG